MKILVLIRRMQYPNAPPSPPYRPGWGNYGNNGEYAQNGTYENVGIQAGPNAPGANAGRTNASTGPNASGTNASAQTEAKSIIQSAVGALLCIPGWLAVRSKVAAASISEFAKTTSNRSRAAYTWATAPKVLSTEEIIQVLRATPYQSAPFLDAIVQDASLSSVAGKSALNAKRAGNLKYRLVLQLVICLFNYENYQKRSVQVPEEIKNLFLDTLTRYLAAANEQQSATARAVVGLTQMGVAPRLTSQKSFGAHQDIDAVWEGVNAIITSERRYNFIRPSTVPRLPPTLDVSDASKKAAFDAALQAADRRILNVTNSKMGRKDGIVGFGNDVAESVQTEDKQPRTCARPPSAALNQVASNTMNNLSAAASRAAGATAAAGTAAAGWLSGKAANASAALRAKRSRNNARVNNTRANNARVNNTRANNSRVNNTRANNARVNGNVNNGNGNNGTLPAPPNERNVNENANVAEALISLKPKRAKTNGNGLPDNGVNTNPKARKSRKSRKYKSKKSKKSRKSRKPF